MTAQLNVFEEFKQDHRKVRDTIFELVSALRQRDVARARELLAYLDALAGPHFRFEEESLYPALRQYLGDYIDKMITDHDGAIAKARGLAALLQKDTLTQDEAGAAMQDVASLLIHVSDCDGLAILMEKFRPEEIAAIGDRIAACRADGVSLLAWASDIRSRAA